MRRISQGIAVVHREGCGSEKKSFRALTGAMNKRLAWDFPQLKAYDWRAGMKEKGFLIKRSIGESWNQLYIKGL
jgi:hypothetical protein